MMPPAAQFAEALGRAGVGDGVRVILYDRNVTMWATRVWWMLRAFGFDDAAVLNGGFKKWTLEGRPVATDAGTRPARTFTPRPRPALMTDKAGVLGALGESGACVLNALSEEQHRGTGGATYGRPGRIAGSVNVAARELVDRNLKEDFRPGMCADDLYGGYVAFGDDPYIVPTPAGQRFSAWDYAKVRCQELCAAVRG